MKAPSLHLHVLPEGPTGVLRMDYVSDRDGRKDWALLLPGRGAEAATWVVCLHGHGARGDQLYTRPDIRRAWLPRWQERGWSVLTPDLRRNAWMSPAAAEDLQGLLAWLRAERGARRFFFFSGSMGGTGNLIYAALHPEDVAGVAALGAVGDLASYHFWCRAQKSPPAPGVLGEIAEAIQRAYGAPPDTLPAPYARHSALAHADRLAMPIFLAHGAEDRVMPVSQPRELAERLSDRTSFRYVEVAGGSHDAPLQCVEAFEWVAQAAEG